MSSQLPIPRLRRREVLRLAAAGSAAWALAGCAPSPLIVPEPGRNPMPAPTLDDSRRSGARAAATLAALATRSADITGADPAFSAWCVALAEQHLAHLTVLGQADPLGGVQADHTPLEQISPEPFTVPDTPAEAMRLLAEHEERLAELLTRVVSESGQTPSISLLWISQRLAAQVAAGALAVGDVASLGPAPVAGDAVPAETGVADPRTAWQVLLSHQRALVFGLQALLGRISFDDPLADPVSVRLGAAMRERDQTTDVITQSGATPRPPAPEYSLPSDEAGPADHRATWGRLELAVMAGWAQIAAADPAGREDASTHALAQAQRARGLGQPLPHWPGWV